MAKKRPEANDAETKPQDELDPQTTDSQNVATDGTEPMAPEEFAELPGPLSAEPPADVVDPQVASPVDSAIAAVAEAAAYVEPTALFLASSLGCSVADAQWRMDKCTDDERSRIGACAAEGNRYLARVIVANAMNRFSKPKLPKGPARVADPR